VLLAALIAAALMPAARLAAPVPSGPPAIVLMVVREIAVGLVLSFAGAVVVGAVTMVGDLIGNNMEMNSGGILRGAIAMPNALADGLATLSAMLFFVAGFHRALLLALARSLTAAPLGAPSLPGLSAMVMLGGRVFAIALELGLPIMIALFVLSLAQGVVSRLAPQINVLVAAPAAILLAGLTLLALDASGLAAGITRAWWSVMNASFGWIDG
jgi:flagellar biosynthetic protein FliR